MPVRAAEIMTTNVKTVRPDDSVARIAQLLADNDISAAPVCDEHGNVVGMVSEGDLLHPGGRDSGANRAWWLSLLAEGGSPSFLDCISTENHRAHHLMVSPVITASVDTDLAELADLLWRHRIKRLPIIQDGKLVGIVSRADLVRAVARTPDAVARAL